MLFEPPVVIDQACTDDPNAPFTELVTVMRVDRNGAWIDETTIEYMVGDHSYTLNVPWQYIACGRSTRGPGGC